ncbi:hypothetical protein D3C76_1265700 [compost metagenome]
MSCERTSLLIEHHIRVTMIRSDQYNAAFGKYCIHNTAHALICYLNRFDGRLQHTGVSNHVRVSKVQNDGVMFVCFDLANTCVSHFIRAHLWLQIIRCNFW